MLHLVVLGILCWHCIVHGHWELLRLGISCRFAIWLKGLARKVELRLSLCSFVHCLLILYVRHLLERL